MNNDNFLLCLFEGLNVTVCVNLFPNTVSTLGLHDLHSVNLDCLPSLSLLVKGYIVISRLQQIQYCLMNPTGN